jgi:hypothetical protein
VGVKVAGKANLRLKESPTCIRDKLSAPVGPICPEGCKVPVTARTPTLTLTLTNAYPSPTSKALANRTSGESGGSPLRFAHPVVDPGGSSGLARGLLGLSVYRSFELCCTYSSSGLAHGLLGLCVCRSFELCCTHAIKVQGQVLPRVRLIASVRRELDTHCITGSSSVDLCSNVLKKKQFRSVEGSKLTVLNIIVETGFM